MEIIALTGATSMIGIALIKQCIKSGVKVIAFVRPNSVNLYRMPNSNLISIINCDLDELSHFKIFGNSDLTNGIFFHLGWRDNEKENRNSCYKQLRNVQYTLDAVHLAKKLGCRRFVGLGGQDEYGLASSPLNSITPIHPVTPTGVAKYAAGKFSKIKCEELGIEYVWVRLLSAYGTNDHEDRLIKTFIKNCKDNIPMDLSPCTHVWDYLYEDDVGNALFLLGNKGIDRKIYILGSGIGKPLKEYLETIKRLINPGYDPGYGRILYSDKSIKYLCADISEITTDTEWKPEIVFEDGVKKILNALGLY